MKKSEIARQYDEKATLLFIAAAAVLTLNALLNNLLSAFSTVPKGLYSVVQFLTLLFILFAYVVTIKGFSYVNKACKLSEENENFYMGKNLMVFSVLSFIFTVIFELIILVLYFILYKYKTAESLTQADLQAANNVKILTAIVLIAAQLTAIAVPYIFYLWRIHKNTPKIDSINNFALLTMLVLIVQLAIGILNALYTIKGAQTSFLSHFSDILLTVKYAVLLLFFIARRKSLLAATDEPIGQESTDPNEP